MQEEMAARGRSESEGEVVKEEDEEDEEDDIGEDEKKQVK